MTNLKYNDDITIKINNCTMSEDSKELQVDYDIESVEPVTDDIRDKIEDYVGNMVLSALEEAAEKDA